MNNYGRLGGSNIVPLQTLPGNYIVNGSFENFSPSDSSVIDWQYNRLNPSFDFKNYSKVIADPNAPDGQRVLSIDLPVYHYAMSSGDLYQPGIVYKQE
jgi:hypothetical protein